MQDRQRRRYERSSARLPVWIRCKVSGNVLQGHTANVSAGGMFILTAGDSELPLGAEVSVVFGIRSDQSEGYLLHEPLRGAEIVRVERHAYGTGIAVKFTEPSFCRCELEPVLA